MTDQDPSVTAAIAAIESATGGRWGVWLSDTGWWWATRTRALTPVEVSAGCLPHVHADNPQELAGIIRQQDNLCPPKSPPETTNSSDLTS
jgi:hypothetical protein